MAEHSLSLLAEVAGSGGLAEQVTAFLEFVGRHWQFCLLHFLEFAIWGAWYVVLGNLLNTRGFSRKDIGRIYSTIPIGSIISPLFIGAVADRFVNTEVLIGVSHLLGAILLFAMARTSTPRPFYWITFVYALIFAPTLSLVNAIVFAHDQDLFGGQAESGFPWIRVFGTIGWIAAGMSHALILRKDQPVNERPLLLACGLSLVLGVFAFTLPATRPAALDIAGKDDSAAEQVAAESREEGVEESHPAESVEADSSETGSPETGSPETGAPETGAARGGERVDVVSGGWRLLRDHPVFFGVSFVTAMAMGLYFAFAALFLEQSGVRPNVVGPVMTLGQWIEIFFMLTLPWFLGPDNIYMNWVLLVGVGAWALRFGMFAIGKPLPLLLLGVAVHGICFDFFFAAGMINTAAISPKGLTATSQSLYGFLVYGLGMYLGSEGSGWLNQAFSRTVPAGEEAAGPGEAARTETNWRVFWLIPCAVITVCAIAFALSQWG